MGGVAGWCQAASAAAFGGTKAWIVPASDGQTHWIKRRLLSQGIGLFGIQFLDPRALRRELCGLLDVPFPVLGDETLELLLRMHARHHPDASATAVLRRPVSSLAALSDLAAAGWLDLLDSPPDLLPSALLDWVPGARASGLWMANIDRRLRRAATRPREGVAPLAVCVLGWDASRWPLRDLLLAALRAADGAAVFVPLPREPAISLRNDWITELETELGAEFHPCPNAGFSSAQAPLAGLLDGADLNAAPPLVPDLLVGADWAATLTLTRDFVARWLIDAESRRGPGGEPVRLAILSPRRTASGVAMVRMLAEAGIPVDDGLGELTEPPPEWQIQRALLAFHQDQARVDSLLTLIELIGARSPLFSLDPIETRRALEGAFGECQHDSARALAEAESLARARVAEPLRALLAHLAAWPEELAFGEALRRWEGELAGLGLTPEILEPHWSQASSLLPEGMLSASAFFQWLAALLGRPAARRAPEGANRFARVAVTTLQNAAGQLWGGAVFLDSHEGAWPLYPGENPFLDDRARRTLNARRTADLSPGEAPECGHLLTSGERAQLEQTQLCELLENCDGPLAFAGPAHDPAEANKEFYPNEWALRCLVESRRGTTEEGHLLDRWRRAIRAAAVTHPPLPPSEEQHLQEVFARRRDPRTPFDEYGFNFEKLDSASELPLDEAWSARDLDALASAPGAFALSRVFGAQPWRHGGRRLARKENWAVGRLVHRWIKQALGTSQAPRRFEAGHWAAARGEGLQTALDASRAALLKRLGRDSLPLWWEGVLRKAEWTARRCLESLADAAGSSGQAEQWVIVDKHFSACIPTPGGPLRLRALCDVALLDRGGFAAAVCHVLDLRTGAPPKSGPLTLTQLDGGASLGLAALLLLAREEGAAPETLKGGVIHPEAANLSMLTAATLNALSGSLAQMAARQRSLIFGQGTPAGPREFEAGEELPMATVPIDPGILRAKAEQTLKHL